MSIRNTNISGLPCSLLKFRYSEKASQICPIFHGEHITDIYVTETDTTELENLSHNIIGSCYLGPQGESRYVN